MGEQHANETSQPRRGVAAAAAGAALFLAMMLLQSGQALVAGLGALLLAVAVHRLTRGPTASPTEIKLGPSGPRVPAEPAGSGALWLLDDARNLAVITFVATTRGPLSRADVEAAVAATGVGAGRYRRLTQRLVHPVTGSSVGCNAGCRPLAVDDADFDLSRHVVGLGEAEVAAAGGDLWRIVAGMMATGLSEDRPPWVLHVWERPDGTTVLVGRFHHVLADGLALASWLVKLTDRPDDAVPRIMRGPRPPLAQRWAAGLKQAAGVPLAVAHAVRKLLLNPPEPRLLSGGRPASGRKDVAFSSSVSFATLRRVKAAFSVTVNDVALACVAHAVASLLSAACRRVGGETPSTVHVAAPASLREAVRGDAMDNCFGFVYVPLDSTPGLTPRQRLEAVAPVVRSMKSRPEALLGWALQEVAWGLLPPAVVKWLKDDCSDRAVAIFSNVPGPPKPLSVRGAAVESCGFFVPAAADIMCNLSLLSNGDRLSVGVVLDDAAVNGTGHSAADVLRLVEEALESLGEEADKVAPVPPVG